MNTRSSRTGPDPVDFRATLGHYPTGVAVVTGMNAEGAPVGMVVGSFTSISLDPPLVAFSPQKGSRSFAALRESPTFCVNVLAADQEGICRQIAGGGEHKYDGLKWSKGPGGAPVIEDVVAWIECSWEQVIEAGDHYIVLGMVQELGISRARPPLLFFQGGYGRFTSPSIMVEAGPDLMDAVRVAERIRAVVEKCSSELGVTCAVAAAVAGELVTVLVAEAAGKPSSGTVGYRMPHLAPVGAVFMLSASDEDVDSWLTHLGRTSEEVPPVLRDKLRLVRERGYSITERSEALNALNDLMADYSSPDSLPSHGRRIREVVVSALRYYEPEIVDGGTYDLNAIAVPIPIRDDSGRFALRLTGLPQGVDGVAVRGWIDTLQRSADIAGQLLSG